MTTVRSRFVFIVALPANGCAARLGIKESDVFLKCNGTPTDGRMDQGLERRREIRRGQSATTLRFSFRTEDAIREQN